MTRVVESWNTWHECHGEFLGSLLENLESNTPPEGTGSEHRVLLVSKLLFIWWIMSLSHRQHM